MLFFFRLFYLRLIYMSVAKLGPSHHKSSKWVKKKKLSSSSLQLWTKKMKNLTLKVSFSIDLILIADQSKHHKETYEFNIKKIKKLKKKMVQKM